MPTATGRPIRILFVDHTAKMSGGEIALLNLVRHLDRGRCEPIVLLYSDGPLRAELAAAGVEVHVAPLDAAVVDTRKDSLGRGGLGTLAVAVRSAMAAVRQAGLIRRLRVDVVHTNSLKSDVIGGLSARLAGVPVVWHVRDRIAADYLPRAAVVAFRWLCRAVPRGVIANSGSTMQTLHLPAGRRWARVIHDGTPVGPVTAVVPGGPPVVGLVGRITRWKGQHVFLDAAERVRAAFPDARFRIVGSVMFDERAYEAELHAQVARLGLGSAVEFTGFRADVGAAMADLAVLVHASVTAEPFGQVVIEAMALGRPVVATAGGGVLEIVDDGVTGLLVPMGDAAAMAAAIGRLLGDPGRAERMGAAGERRVRERFSIERTARAVEQYHAELLGR